MRSLRPVLKYKEFFREEDVVAIVSARYASSWSGSSS
jgi:hypothetical protein